MGGILDRCLAVYVGLLWVSSGACNLALEFAESVSEEGVELCSDGLDNDQDGKLDCDDESCACNECDGGTAVPPPHVDALGQVCSRNCECRRYERDDTAVCNPRARTPSGTVAGRCIEVDRLDGSGEVFVEDEGFFVRFLLETDGNCTVPLGTLSQNVLGVARFRGERFELSSAEWPDGQVEFRTPGLDQVLVATILGTVSGSPCEKGSLLLQDGLEQDDDARRTALGPVTLSPSGVSLIAVVQSSTLTVEQAAQPGVLAVGTWRGGLRSPAAIDRVVISNCDTNQIFHPDLQRCFPEATELNDSFFVFGCVLDEAAPVGSGEFAFRWSNPRSSRPDDTRGVEGGTCIARRTASGIEVRAQPSPATVNAPVIFKMMVDFDALAAGTSVPNSEIGPLGAYFQDSPEGPFAVPLDGPPDVDFQNGRLFIELIEFGETPRFFAWFEGRVN